VGVVRWHEGYIDGVEIDAAMLEDEALGTDDVHLPGLFSAK
jgi:hypothetical protein